MKRFTPRALLMPGLVLALCGACLFAVLPGCQTDARTGAITLGGAPLPTTQQIDAARDGTVAKLQATTQAAAEVQRQVDALPAGDPARKPLQSALDELNQRIVELNKGVDLFDAARRTAATGQVDPQLVSAAGSLLGPYGSLAVVALGAVGTIFGTYQKMRAGGYFKAASQIVQSVEAAGPRTDDQKLRMTAVQDERTRQIVDKIKANLPEPDPRPAVLPSPAN